ncbi:MFS transporter [Eubacteriaceae bacterium ES2]|nr:MFS transporter [Eubacteriaceae bacterium ES2]
MENIKIDEKRANKCSLGSMLMCALAIGAYSSLSVYIGPLVMKLGVSVTQVVLLFTFSAISALIGALLIGAILKKVRIRLLVPVGGLLLGSFFVILGLANSIELIYIGAFVFGVATTFTGVAVAQTQVMWWYAKDAGKKLGNLVFFMGAGSMLFNPILAKLLTMFSVETVAIGEGVLLATLIVLIGLFMLSENPETYGLKPVGYEEVASQNTSGGNSLQTAPSMSLKQILSTPSFWFVVLALGIMGTASTGFSNNASALFQSKGLDAVTAAMMISINSGVAVVMGPIFGRMVDKIGNLKATTIFGVSLAVVFFIGSITTGMVGALILAVGVAFRTFNGMMGPVAMTNLFGRKEAGSLVGFTTASASIGAMLGAPLAGYVYDATGSYNAFLIAAAVMTLLTVTLLYLGTNNKSIERIKIKQTKLEEQLN